MESYGSKQDETYQYYFEHLIFFQVEYVCGEQ